MQQQGSGFGSGSSFGSSSNASSSGFGAFGRPQQAPSASTSSSAPPNTFFRPPSNGASSSAFNSGFDHAQQQQQQQHSGFVTNTPRPFNSGPRPSFQQSSFGASRPFHGGQQARPQQAGFNAPRPFAGDQQSQVQGQQQQTSFGSRPRPFTSRSNGPGMTQEGRPPNSNAFRGGRGGGTIRPVRPFASHSNVNQQSGPTTGGTVGMEAGPSNQQTSRPRPRPFANKSTTFNTQAQQQQQQSAPASSFGNPANATPSAPTSAFGASTDAQSPAAASSFNQPTSSFSSAQTQGAFGASTSAFGSNYTNAPSATSAFGSSSTQNTATAFGSASQSSAFGSAPNGSTSTSAFGRSQDSSAFAGSTFSAPQTASAAPSASSVPTTHPASNTPSAPSAAPTSSFSNFLRKDRTGNSAPDAGTGPSNDNKPADEDEMRKKRFEDAPKVGNRFLEMKGGREALRNAYIKSGVLPDPDKPTDLALAVKLVGTCEDMCPEFEREEREFQKELDPLELYPGTDRVDPRIAVKIYRRPAAGRELPLPEDVRPPPVLKRTLDYLFHDLLPADPNDPRFTQVQGFLWNRTRAVRQDFIVQSEGGSIAIECHERIARYHILCLHWRGGPGAEGWSEQQELEQLRKTMRSLIEFYDDNRRKTSGTGAQQASPNEAEFRAYNLLLHLRDPETLREAELLPGDIFRSPLVQTAINLRQLAQRSNNLEKRGQPRNTEATLNFFSKFFAELRKPTSNYLMACLAENSFSSVRIGGLKAMSKAYMAQHRAMPIERLQHVLGMDSAEQVIAMATHLGLELEFEADKPVGVKIHRSAMINEDKPLVAPFSSTIVEAKRGSYSSADVVDGRASGASAMLNTTQAGQGSAPAIATTQFGKAAQTGATPSFGLKTHGQPGNAFASATTPPFAQQPAGMGKSLAFDAPSKLSPAASSFKPNTFVESSSSKEAPATASSSFGGFGNNGSKKEGDVTKVSASTFGAFGGPSSQPKHEAASAPSFFGNKAASSDKPSETAPNASSLPGFSFGPPAKATEAAQPDSAKTSQPAAPSFSFGAPPKTDTATEKPSIPSFFGVSPAAKPTDAPSKPAETKQATPAPSTGTQKRRASDTNEKVAAQAAAAAVAAAKADAEKRAQAKRKEATRTHAVDRAYRQLTDEVARSVSKETAARVAHEEEVRRRAASRNHLLSRISDQLWQQLAEEHAAEAAEETSRIAAAEVFRSRSCAMRAWSRWMDVLGERRDREQQRRRLEDIRTQIRQKKIATHDSDDTSPIRRAFSIRQALLTGERTANLPSKRKHEDDSYSTGERRASLHNDEELTEKWTKVRRQRDQLWAEGSLLERLADHVEKLLLHFRPAELDRLVVLYSGAPGQHVASSWLRVKFGFSPTAPSGEEGRDVLEIDLADGSQLELVDATPAVGGGGNALEAVLSDGDDHRQPGLVIFETSPAAARSDSVVERHKVLAQDRQRLEDLASCKLVRESQLACRLLVVSWGGEGSGMDRSPASAVYGDDDVEMDDVDSTLRRSESSLTHLGLDLTKVIGTSSASFRPTVPSRTFEHVGILPLDDASISVESALTTLLPRVMPELTPNPALYTTGRRQTTLGDVALGYYDQWARTGGLLFDLVSSLSSALEAKTEQVACKSLHILTALANHIVRTILSLSETILKDAEVETLVLPLPSTAHGAKLVGMALSQLDQLPADEEQKMHLRSTLLSTLHPSKDTQQMLTAVLRQHLDRLFRYSLQKLEQVWIRVRPETTREWDEAEEVFGGLCETAVEEVAGETRVVAAEARMKGRRGEGEMMEVKRVRTDVESKADMTREGGDGGRERESGKIWDLRELMARTRRFLDSPTSSPRA